MSTLGVYILDKETQPKQIATCDDDALTFCLRTLRDEGQITSDDDVGILALDTRLWIINPFPASVFGRRT